MYVRPHLDYGDIIYHNQRQDLMNQIEQDQYKAALIVTGCWKGTNRDKLHDELGWESLSDRRFSNRIMLLHKILDNRTPYFLNEKLPPKRRPFLFQIFREIRCRTNKYKDSFFPSTTSSWNDIISHFRSFPITY